MQVRIKFEVESTEKFFVLEQSALVNKFDAGVEGQFGLKTA